MGNTNLPTRIQTLRRRLVFTWFLIGPATITVYIAVARAISPMMAQKAHLPRALAASMEWILVGTCLVGTVAALIWGRAMMSDARLERAAMKGPTAQQTDPLAFQVMAAQLGMGAFAEMIALVGLLMFVLGAPFDRFLSFAIYSLGLNIYIGGTIPARLNKFDEVASSMQGEVNGTGECQETV
jgi:hypothetical protein